MNRSPNIVWIVSDHQVRPKHSAIGDLFPLQTRLTKLGMKFNRSYSVLPICSPARASMLTGLYPHAHGLTENDGRFGGRSGLDETDWMIQYALKSAGYRCAWFGKWHLNNQRSAIDFGFEGFSLPGYGYPYSSESYRSYLNKLKLDNPVARIEISGESGLSPDTEIDLVGAGNWYDYEAGTAILDSPAETHEAYFVTELAKDWLDSKSEEPFFVRIDTWGPHPPYLVARPYFDSLVDSDIELPDNYFIDLKQRPQHHRDYRDYWQAVLKIDDSDWSVMYRRALEHAIQVESALVGLLDHIDLDNTLVIFTSDHGDAVGSNGGVANKGGLMVEATMCIPMLLAGAGIEPGTSSEHLVGQLDLVPTLAELCKLQLPENRHGNSLLPLIENGEPGWRTGLMTQHYGLHEPLLQRAWYQDEFKLVVQSDGFRELYNLNLDPGETHNLAFDPGQASRLSSLQSELCRAMQAVDDSDASLDEIVSRSN